MMGLIASLANSAQFTYLQDVNLYAGTTEGEYGNGISLYDINHDGFDDITICTKDQGVLIYMNDSLSFEENNVIPFVPGDLKHPVWVDYDNDNDPDFCVTSLNGVFLFRNDGGVFTDISDSLHLPSANSVTYGTAWADYDGDGWLDVYIANYEYFFPDSNTNWLLRNKGQGGFEDVTDQCACDNGQAASFQPVWLDADDDLKPDLFIINDKFHGNGYYHNEGNSFSDASVESGFFFEMESMSNSWTDIDHNLLPDVYISNTTAGNVLLRMTENGFVNTAPENGLEINSVCWNAMWLDYDHNGWEDLHVATNSIGINQNINPLFRHVDDEFYPITIQGDNRSVLCTAKGDLNNDGYWDYVEITQFPLSGRIFLNNGGNHHWIKCGFQGTASNHDGVGAVIHYFIDEEEKLRYTFCGEGFLSQDSQVEILSLGPSASLDSMYVKWPSGWIDRYYNIPADSYMLLTEGETFWYESMNDHFLASCENDTVDVYVNSSHDVIWFDGINADTRSFSHAGVYTYEVFNELGFSFTDSVSIELLDVPDLTYHTENASCFGSHDGSIILDNPEAESFIQWNPDTLNIMSLHAGWYDFTWMDEYGCEHADTFMIDQPALIEIKTFTEEVCEGMLSPVIWEIDGGVAPYHLMDGDVLPDSLYPGEYDLMIMDANTCVVQYELFIDQAESPWVEIVNESINDVEFLIASVSGGTSPFQYIWNNGEIEDTILCANSGWFEVQVMDANGCLGSDALEMVSQVSELTKCFNVFPNPCRDHLFVFPFVGDFELYDMQGKLLRCDKLMSTGRIDVSDLPVGNYCLRLNPNHVVGIVMKR